MTFDDVSRKTEQFGALLDSIENLEDKKKHLWREIYENATVDRMNAYMLFTDVYSTMTGDKADHVTLGPMMAKYIEKLQKSAGFQSKLRKRRRSRRFVGFSLFLARLMPFGRLLRWCFFCPWMWCILLRFVLYLWVGMRWAYSPSCRWSVPTPIHRLAYWTPLRHGGKKA